jgi:hypothetical protein
MKRLFLALMLFFCVAPGAALAKLALKPAPQLWVYAAKMDVESAKKLVEQNHLDPSTLGRALFNSLRRYKSTGPDQQVAIARLLLTYGADANYAALNGQTSLMAAASTQSEILVRLLLENGANPAAVDTLGRTAADYAKSSSLTPELVLALLRNPPPLNLLCNSKPKLKAEVQNLAMAEEGKSVIFTFDLQASDPVCVKLIGSLDGGATYGMTFKYAIGDLGKGVNPGTGKRIVWSADKDYPKGLTGDNILVDVVANYCD